MQVKQPKNATYAAEGVPAPPGPDIRRDASGRVTAGSDSASALARAGARAAKESRELGRLLGLWQAPAGHPWLPYSRLCREWRDDHMRTLAATVGGGEVGPGPASIISTAAMQMAASRFLYDVGAQAGDPRLLTDASRLGDSSRQNLLAAHELCAREAMARKAQKAPDAPWLTATPEPED